ncbi:hypothetical protein [Paenibacillus sp. MER 99-2]|uniref:hypothetical protein n=1 Tax=Paenibacillus sp. MER 99-2 TaxID=2939572 RepID=UPI00203A3D0F|nr:hypothetical protein [Paenibacillus sp. MER 99-2]MCM3173437.1 hypothetical protein [Paenibacillus sp. MER 99-2]
MELHVELIPNLRTIGGEVLDVMVHGQYVGSLLVVYRETDRLSGSLQLERGSLTEESEEVVMEKVHEYVRSLVDAVEAEYYEVLVNCGTLRSVLLKPDTEVEVEWYEDESICDRDYDDTVSAIQVIPGSQDESFTYEDQEHLLEMELVTAGRNISTYVFNDVQGQELAEATLKQYGADVQGEIHWYDEPDEHQQEIAAELLVRELDEELIDTITIHYWHQGNHLDSIEWVHRDFAGDDDDDDEEYNAIGVLTNASHYDTSGVARTNELQDRDEQEDAEDISYVMLVRKDREFREYELFLQERGGLPVGTATIDTSHPDLTGYMDYQIPGTNVQRQSLVEVLLKELDKDLEFHKLHLTMLYRNQVIDEARIDR